MRLLLLTLALAVPLCLPAQSTGDVLLGTKSASGGQTPVWITKTASRAIGWDSSGNLTTLTLGSGGGTWGTITGTLADQTDLQAALAARLVAASNLSDLTNAATARTNLGLGTLATQNGTLSDYLTTATAASTYQPLSATLTTLSSATAAGLALMDDATAADQRTTLGLGTLATQSATISDYLTTATAASTYQPLDADLTSIAALTTTSFGRGLLTETDAASTRSTLGLGTLATQSATITDYLTTATAASTYQPVNAKLTAFGSLANGAGLFTNNGSGTYSWTATTTGGNGSADSSKIPLLTANGGLVLGKNDIADGNVITLATGYGYGIAINVAEQGTGIYSELNGGYSQGYHAHVTSSSVGVHSGFDADMTGGTGVNFANTALMRPDGYAIYNREFIGGVGYDRFTIDAQGDLTWYANGTTLTTGTNKTSLVAETPSGTALYNLRAGNVTGYVVSTADTGTVTNTMLAGSIAASKLVGTDIATVGTITSGAWQGSVIAPAYLGTGSSISTKFLRGDGTWQTVDLSGYLPLSGGTLTGPLVLPAGSVSAASLTFGDADTGLYSSSATASVDVAIAGARMLQINSTGLRLANDTQDTIWRRSDVGMLIFHGQGSSSTGVGFPGYKPGISFGSAGALRFTNDTPASSDDIYLHRVTTSVLGIKASSATTGAAVELNEMTAPGTPGSDRARLYLEDNGSGKTRLVIKWSDGTTEVIAVQP